MATAQQIQEKFIQPLEGIFGEPRWKGADPEVIYAALVEDLARFPLVALDEAVKDLRRDNKGFPSIQACVQACWKARGVTHLPTPMQRPNAAWDARLAAIRTIRTNIPMAEKADRESWLVALIDFAQDHERLPSERETVGLATLGRKNNERCHIEGNPVMTSTMFNFRKLMLERAHRDVFGKDSILAATPDQRNAG